MCHIERLNESCRIQTVAQEADAVSNCGCDGDFGQT